MNFEASADLGAIFLFSVVIRAITFSYFFQELQLSVKKFFEEV